MVFKTHKTDIDTLFGQLRKMNEDYIITKQKISYINDNMHTMCRETVEYFFDHKLDEKLNSFVSMEEFKAKMKAKLDYDTFNHYVKGEIEKSEQNQAQLPHHCPQQLDACLPDVTRPPREWVRQARSEERAHRRGGEML